MGPRNDPQPRIVISKRTTPERLMEQVTERRGTTFLIVGTGARARRLIDWLAREIPGPILRVPRVNGEHTAVILDPHEQEAFAFGNDETGKPPTVTRIHGTPVNGRS